MHRFADLTNRRRISLSKDRFFNIFKNFFLLFRNFPLAHKSSFLSLAASGGTEFQHGLLFIESSYHRSEKKANLCSIKGLTNVCSYPIIRAEHLFGNQF